MARHRQTPMDGGLFPLPAQQRSREPLHEEPRGEDKKAHERKLVGMYKAIVLGKKSLIKYVYEDPKAWQRISKVWSWVQSQGIDRYKYADGLWWLIFSVLEKERNDDFKRLKDSWRWMGGLRKDVLFACGVKEHGEFLNWVIKQRVGVQNDSMPWMFEEAIKGILRILTNHDDLLVGYRESVEERLGRYEYKEHFVAEARIKAFEELLYDILFTLKHKAGLSKEELKKAYKKIVKSKEIQKELSRMAIRIAKMISPEYFVNTASQDTQNV